MPMITEPAAALGVAVEPSLVEAIGHDLSELHGELKKGSRAGASLVHLEFVLTQLWARRQGHPIKVAPDAIRAVPTSAYPTPAHRPLNSRLSTRKLRDTFGLHPPAWETGVERMLTEVLGK